MVSKSGQPRVGDRVLVPWGLDEVLGEIVEVYSTGLGPRVRVRMVDNPDGPTVTLPLDSVTAEGAREKITQLRRLPTAWCTKRGSRPHWTGVFEVSPS